MNVDEMEKTIVYLHFHHFVAPAEIRVDLHGCRVIFLQIRY